MATRTRHAKLVSCEQVKTPLPGMTEVSTGKAIDLDWVATDAAGRRFVDSTKEGAEKMLAEYNHLKEVP